VSAKSNNLLKLKYFLKLYILKIIYKKMCINYRIIELYYLKNKPKLKVVLFGCSKSIRTRKFFIKKVLFIENKH